MAIMNGYFVAMRTVNVAELKNALSRYLRLAERGETILVRSRDRIVARLEGVRGPVRAGEEDEQRLERLQARGTLRRGKGRVTLAMLGPPVRSDPGLVSAVRTEREEGW